MSYLSRISTAAVLAWFVLGNPFLMAQEKQEEVTLRTGPPAGAKIPPFEAMDHTGQRQTFETLKGPNGLLLLFSRSADW